MNEKEEIGKVIRLLRKEKALTQKDLGEVFNVSRDSVSLWELGKCMPDIIMLKRIAEFFDVSADYILGLD